MRKVDWRTFLILLFLSLLLIFLDQRGVLTGVREAGMVVLAPVMAEIVLVKNRTGEILSVVGFWRSGESRIRNLEQRNLELTVAANREKALLAENDELRRQLGAPRPAAKKLLAAPVLGVSRVMVIGVGQVEGVRAGQTVIYLDNLVGLVERSGAHVSFVQLPYAAGVRIPARVEGAAEPKGMVTGQFGSGIQIDQLAQGEGVVANELVLTTGADGVYFPDMVIGKISRILSKETDLFKRAEVEPLVRYDKLMTVFVILE